MRALVSVVAFLVMCSVCANTAICQIDSSTGQELSAQIKDEEAQFAALRSRSDALFRDERFDGTYEFVLLSQDLTDCAALLQSAERKIYDLYYASAKQDLGHANKLLQAMQTILSEDSNIPVNELSKESTINNNYPPSAEIPLLKGPSLRAAIASELSFAQRSINRAHFNLTALAILKIEPSRHNPCLDAQNSFLERASEAENKLGYTRQVASPDLFFQRANAELRLLHYQAAQDLAYLAFTSAQQIMSVCSAQPY